MTDVGVPLIAPVEVSSDKPAGSDGDTDHVVTVVSEEHLVVVAIVVLFVIVDALTL